MQKEKKVFFCLLLMAILTACNVKENNSTDNISVTEIQMNESTAISAELETEKPTAMPVGLETEKPTAMPVELETEKPIATPVEASTETPTPRPKGDIPERSYDSHRDFPYENMDFVDDTTYVFLKQVYDEIDFYGEFQVCDLTVYDEYIEAYRKLVNNEIPFIVQDSYIVPQIGESYYLSNYSTICGVDEFDPYKYAYYLFDMDGDGNPEFCIWNYGTYIFKYDIQSEEMVLWMSMGSSYERIHGTQTLRWDWEGVYHTLCRLNELGEVVFGVYFMEEATWSNGKETFMVTVPSYEDKEIEITIEMKKQAYFNEEDGLYYFNITEEQYNELTKDYFRAREQSEEELKKVTYTYDELFQEE